MWLTALTNQVSIISLAWFYLDSKNPQKFRGLNFEDKGHAYIVPQSKNVPMFSSENLQIWLAIWFITIVTRYDTHIFHNKARTAASPFKTPFRAKGLRYYCIWPSVTNARIGYIYNVRLRYSETIYNPSFWASRQGPGPPQQQQQQQHPEPGSQFLKANISRQLNRNIHSRYAYFAQETNQLTTL